MLWMKRNMFNGGQKSAITKRLNRELLQRTGHKFPTTLHIKIPFHSEIPNSMIKKEVCNIIKNGQGRQFWKDLICKSIYIVRTQQHTVGDLLLNYRHIAKMDIFKINTCVCDSNKEGRNESEHLIWRMEDKEPFLTSVNTNTVLATSEFNITYALHSQLQQLAKLIKQHV
jgi:hypothetical protein